MGQICLQQRQEVAVGGLDAALDGLHDGRSVGTADLGVGHQECRPLGGRANQPARLGDGPFDHCGCRGPTRREPGPEVVADRGHVRRVGIESGDEPRQAFGSIDPLEPGQLRRQGLRTVHLVDAVHLPQPMRVILPAHVGDHPQDVEGDPVLRWQVRMPQGSHVPLQIVQDAELTGTSGLGRIIQAIIVTFVAEHGRPQRIALQEALPEAVGERIDGARHR